MAKTRSCFIKSNLRIATASGWLERFVRCRTWLDVKVSLGPTNLLQQLRVAAALVRSVLVQSVSDETDLGSFRMIDEHV